MRTPKSHTDFIVGFYEVLLTQDMVRQYGEPSQFKKDYEKIRSRVRNEGTSFATKTLPVLAKAFDKALVTGVFTCPPHLKRMKGTAYPLILNVLLKRVFNCDGSLKNDPCVSAVRDVRQICYLFYKYELPHAPELEATMALEFEETDRRLGGSYDEFRRTHLLPLLVSDAALLRVLGLARTLLRDLLEGFHLDDVIPGHGPGAVATGEKNWEKMEFKRLYQPLHQEFPYYKFFVTNAMELAANVKEYKSLLRVPDAGCAKITFVPKDSRGPRIISMEPLEYQFIEQGIRAAMYDWIESHPLTAGRVCFTDQSVNGALALAGSVSGDIVTLDMKEASDRVSVWLVKELFSETSILDKLLAARTSHTLFEKQGLLVKLNKFAPMGSAICFPVMALVHWSLAVASLNVVGGMSVQHALKSIYVYGDDIIVKGKNHKALFDTFPYFGLKFNEGKCCTEGFFRESCGTDAFLGERVSPIRIKKLWSPYKLDANRYASYTDYINSLWDDAYYSSSDYVKDLVESTLPRGCARRIPVVEQTADVPGLKLGRFRCSNSRFFKRRWNKDLQRFEHRVLRTVGVKLSVDLNRREYQRKMLVSSPEFRAGVYSVPRRVKLRMGWSSALVLEPGSDPR